MSKRLLAILLVLVMLLGMLPSAALAQENAPSNSNEGTPSAEPWEYRPGPQYGGVSAAYIPGDPVAANALSVTVTAQDRYSGETVPVADAEVTLCIDAAPYRTVYSNAEGVANIPVSDLTQAQLRCAWVTAKKVVAKGDAISGSRRDSLFNYFPSEGGENIRYKLELHSEDIDVAGNWVGAPVPEVKNSGKVDAVFVIDATGSMYDEINNVKNNLMDFSNALVSKGLDARFSVIEYRDITCDEETILHTWNGSHWYTDPAAVQSVLGTIDATGGGDGPETVIDALGIAASNSMNWRSDAAKFAFVLTDADYKVNNNFGYTSLTDISNTLKAKNIVVTVCTSSYYYDDYSTLTDITGGSMLDIYASDFNSEMMSLADSVGGATLTKMTVTLREPRILYNLAVCYLANDDVSRSDVYRGGVENMLREYAKAMAQATDGHVIIDKVLLFTTDRRLNFYDTNNLAAMADIHIETIEGEKARVHSNAYVTGFYDDSIVPSAPSVDAFASLDDVQDLYGRYTFLRIQMSGVEGAGWENSMLDQAYQYATTVAHESGHYLLGLFDEYMNQNRTSWRVAGGRPYPNYGLMDGQHSDIEISKTPIDYAYFGGYIPGGSDSRHTNQSYRNGGSCEDSLATLLESGNSYYGNLIYTGPYLVHYTKTPASGDRTAAYPWAVPTIMPLGAVWSSAPAGASAYSDDLVDASLFDGMTHDDSAIGEIRVTTDGTDAYVSVDGADPASTTVYVRALGETAFSRLDWEGASSGSASAIEDETAGSGHTAPEAETAPAPESETAPEADAQPDTADVTEAPEVIVADDLTEDALPGEDVVVVEGDSLTEDDYLYEDMVIAESDGLTEDSFFYDESSSDPFENVLMAADEWYDDGAYFYDGGGSADEWVDDGAYFYDGGGSADEWVDDGVYFYDGGGSADEWYDDGVYFYDGGGSADEWVDDGVYFYDGGSSAEAAEQPDVPAMAQSPEAAQPAEASESAQQESAGAEELLMSASASAPATRARIPDGVGAMLEIRVVSEGDSVYGSMIAEITEPVSNGYLFTDESGCLSAYARVSDAQSLVFGSSQRQYSNGAYTSITDAFQFSAQNPDAVIDGKVMGMASSKSSIDFSGVSWFYLGESGWQQLATSFSDEENTNIACTASLCGPGIYALMAAPATGSASAPAGLTCTPSETEEGRVLVSFSDGNAGSKFYNIYYSDRPFSDTSDPGVVAVRCDASSTTLALDLRERDRTVYVGVETVLENGSRSPLAMTTVTTPEVDSDKDGIPDWYATKYNLWPLEGEEKNVAESDDDRDGLSNLAEYRGGSSPLDPDDPVRTTPIPVEGVTVSPNSLRLGINSQAVVSAALTPAEATDREIIWSVEDDSVVSIESAGATCTVTGLAVGETDVYAVSHDGGYSAKVHVTVTELAPKETVTLSLPKYYAVENTEEFSLPFGISPVYLANQVCWSLVENIPSDGVSEVLSITEEGRITPLAEGAAVVEAYVCTSDDSYYSAQCRIDVTETPVAEAMLTEDGIVLSTKQVTSELYSRDYARVDVAFFLKQNLPAGGAAAFEDVDSAAVVAVATPDTGMAIRSAFFKDKATSEMFDLFVFDDRTLVVVPTETAISSPKSVKASYSSPIVLEMDEGTFTTADSLKLTVKKSQPKLKAENVKLDAFKMDTAQLSITGATVDWDNTDVVTTPEWLWVDGDTVGFNYAPGKTVNGKLTLSVSTKEWVTPATVTIQVNASFNAPKLKLNPASLTLPTVGGYAYLNLESTDKNATLSSLGVVGVTCPSEYGYEVYFYGSTIYLYPTASAKAGKVPLDVHFADTPSTVPLTVNVTKKDVTLKANPAKVTLRTDIDDSAAVTLTATPDGYPMYYDSAVLWRVTDSKNKETDALNLSLSSDMLHISPSDTAKPGNYKVYVKANTGPKAKETAIAVTLADKSGATPTMTLKASGTLDLAVSGGLTFTPTFKDYSGGYATLTGWSVTAGKGSTAEDVSDLFSVYHEGSGALLLYPKSASDALDVKQNYTLHATLTLCSSSREPLADVSADAAFKIKRSPVTLKLSKSAVTLNKDANDMATLAVSCPVKNFWLESPLIEVTPAAAEGASEALDYYYEPDYWSSSSSSSFTSSGTLYVGTNSETEYGKTYQLRISATRHDKPVVLKVTIPAKAKSNITATLKVKGNLDPTRRSSVTITPTFKNIADPSLLTLTPTVLLNGEETYDFNIHQNDDGSFTVSNLVTVLDKAAYTFALSGKVMSSPEDSLDDSPVLGSVKLPVKRGAVKLTQKGSPILYRKDVNSRAFLRLDSADASLNPIARVTFKTEAQENQFALYEYGGGNFAIGFQGGNIPAKKSTVSIPLNVFLMGNDTEKPDATVTVKVAVE